MPESKQPEPPRSRAAQRREAARKAREARERRRRLIGIIVVVIVLAGAGIGIGFAVAGGSNGSRTASGTATPTVQSGSLASLGTLEQPGPQGPTGPEGIPIPNVPQLTGTSTIATGNTVDGIQCNTSEQVVYHIHAHLTVFVNGSQRQIPYGIGIPNAQATQTAQGPFVEEGSCFYWLHTHAADGIIHIESPAQKTYTLGDFFDIWGQPLSPTQVGPAKGTVVALYNGQHYLGNPRDIPLTAHANIQLEVGKPLVAPVIVQSWGGL